MTRSFDKRADCVFNRKASNTRRSSENPTLSLALEQTNGKDVWQEFYTMTLSDYHSIINNRMEMGEPTYFHDIMTHDEPIKFIMDMDMKPEDLQKTFMTMSKTWDTQFFSSEMRHLIESVQTDYDKSITYSDSIERLFYTMCVNHARIALSMCGKNLDEGVVYASASRKDKLSMHIVCDSIIFKDSTEMADFLDIFKIRLLQLFIETRYTMPLLKISCSTESDNLTLSSVALIIDSGVYPSGRTDRTLRAFYSSKRMAGSHPLEPLEFILAPMYKAERDGMQCVMVQSCGKVGLSLDLLRKSIPILLPIGSAPHHGITIERARYGLCDGKEGETLRKLVQCVEYAYNRFFNVNEPDASIRAQTQSKYPSWLPTNFSTSSSSSSLYKSGRNGMSDSLYFQDASCMELLTKILAQRIEPHFTRVRSLGYTPNGGIPRGGLGWTIERAKIKSDRLCIDVKGLPCFNRENFEKEKSRPILSLSFRNGSLSQKCFHSKCHTRNHSLCGCEHFTMGKLSTTELESILTKVDNIAPHSSHHNRQDKKERVSSPATPRTPSKSLGSTLVKKVANSSVLKKQSSHHAAQITNNLRSATINTPGKSVSFLEVTPQKTISKKRNHQQANNVTSPVFTPQKKVHQTVRQ